MSKTNSQKASAICVWCNGDGSRLGSECPHCNGTGLSKYTTKEAPSLNAIGEEYHHNDEYFTRAELKKYKTHCKTCDVLLVGNNANNKNLKGDCSICSARKAHPNNPLCQVWT